MITVSVYFKVAPKIFLRYLDNQETAHYLLGCSKFFFFGGMIKVMAEKSSVQVGTVLQKTLKANLYHRQCI